MKTLGVALLSSVITAFLVALILKNRPVVLPIAPNNVLSVRELHIVDESGTVRMTLGTHGHWSKVGDAAFDMVPLIPGQGGAGFVLDENGRGSLWFNSGDTDAKVMIGHFVTEDTYPISESGHAWGVRVINLKPVTGAPDSLYFAASEGGNVTVGGVTIKQGPPPDVKPVTVHGR